MVGEINYGSRAANLKAMYDDLKLGYMIYVGSLAAWLDTSQWDKDYINYLYYGSWSTTVNFKEFVKCVRDNASRYNPNTKFEYYRR